MKKHKSRIIGPFPGTVLPVREGMYRRCGPSDRIFWSWWNGHRWSVYAASLDVAYANRNITSNCQNLPWYGWVKP